MPSMSDPPPRSKVLLPESPELHEEILEFRRQRELICRGIYVRPIPETVDEIAAASRATKP